MEEQETERGRMVSLRQSFSRLYICVFFCFFTRLQWHPQWSLSGRSRQGLFIQHFVLGLFLRLVWNLTLMSADYKCEALTQLHFDDVNGLSELSCLVTRARVWPQCPECHTSGKWPMKCWFLKKEKDDLLGNTWLMLETSGLSINLKCHNLKNRALDFSHNVVHLIPKH